MYADRENQLNARAEIRVNIERALKEGFDHEFAEQVFACVLEYFQGEERMEKGP
jgi:hypothetical protein